MKRKACIHPAHLLAVSSQPRSAGYGTMLQGLIDLQCQRCGLTLVYRLPQGWVSGPYPKAKARTATRAQGAG